MIEVEILTRKTALVNIGLIFKMKINELEPIFAHPAEVRLGEIVKDGCAPKGVYLTTNQIEFFYSQGAWRLPGQPRMDGIVRRGSQRLHVVEMNKLEKGERVILGCSEDGSEGIYVTTIQKAASNNNGQFSFMTNDVSRERRVDYSHLATVLGNAREGNGKIVWVLGPAVVHAGGIESMEWLIKRGYVGALLGGNAIAAHDVEHAMFGTSLGLGDNSYPVDNGHRNHLEAINAVRTAGSIEAAVNIGLITKGIMYECVRNNVPVVLAGSIRDDGPLPDTITDSLKSQDAMRAQTIDASCVVMLATALHSIATGNMTPTYRVVGDEIRELPIICVDSDEFTVMKLTDRGTSQAHPVIANVRDFLSLFVNQLARQDGLMF